MDSINIDYRKKNFFNTAIADIYRAIDGKSLVGSFILTFCLIDQLTWIEFGEEKLGFNKWVIKRLLPLNIFYTAKDRELYSVRNGLVHSYGPSRKIIQKTFEGYELQYCSPEFHLQRVNNNILRICLYSLLTETVYAAHLTFEEFKIQGTKEQIGRMEQQLAILRTKPPQKYAQMHRELEALDEPSTLSVRYLQADFTKMILYPGHIQN